MAPSSGFSSSRPLRSLGGPTAPPTSAQLLAALPGSYVQVWPRQSKCDATGEVWGDKATFHSLDDNVGNCFSALRAYVVALLRREGAYGPDTPLFLTDDLTLVSASQAQRLLHGMLVSASLDDLAQSISWHSFRISLATRLGRIRCPPDKIQALCRWQSAESLLIYRRLGLSDYHEWIERDAFSAEFEVGDAPSVCVDSAVGLLALSAHAPTDSPSPAPRHAPAAPTPQPPAPPPALTMRSAVGRSVLVPILPGWEVYACDENGGRGWTARIVAKRARACVSVRFLHARDPAGLAYPDHTLPLAVLEALP